MGYYIETDSIRNKAKRIEQLYGGRIVSFSEAQMAMKDSEKAVIVVVDNYTFEAAGFAYDMNEFEAFTDKNDRRAKTFVVLDRNVAKELTRYKGV